MFNSVRDELTSSADDIEEAPDGPMWLSCNEGGNNSFIFVEINFQV